MPPSIPGTGQLLVCHLFHEATRDPAASVLQTQEIGRRQSEDPLNMLGTQVC